MKRHDLAGIHMVCKHGHKLIGKNVFIYTNPRGVTTYRCKTCNAKQSSEWHKAHPEYNKKWHEEHPGYWKAYYWKKRGIVP